MKAWSTKSCFSLSSSLLPFFYCRCTFHQSKNHTNRTVTQYAHIFRPSHRSGGRKHTFYHRLVGFTFLRCYWTAKGKLLRRPPSMLSLLRGQAKKKVAKPMAQECESTLEGPIPRHQGTSPWHSIATCPVEATGARTSRGSPQERERMLSTELIFRLTQHIKY